MKESQTAIKAAKEAGKLLKENFHKEHDVSKKSKREIVTETDLASEKIIIDILKKDYPEYSILSEEDGKSGDSGDYMWIVDPLDGSTNYSIKNPFFNVSIALAKKTKESWEIVSGVVHVPLTKEMFFAEKNEGSFLNGEKIQVSKEVDIDKLLFYYCHGSSDKDVSRAVKLFSLFKPRCNNFTKPGAAAMELAYVAAGRIGGTIFLGTKSWDVAAGQLLVKEAGGIVTDFSDNEWNIETKDMVAANKNVHDKVLEILKDIK